MEGSSHIWGMYIAVHFPAVVSSVTTLPLDEVLELIPVHATVHDCFNFELFGAINQDQGGRGKEWQPVMGLGQAGESFMTGNTLWMR